MSKTIMVWKYIRLISILNWRLVRKWTGVWSVVPWKASIYYMEHENLISSKLISVQLLRQEVYEGDVSNLKFSPSSEHCERPTLETSGLRFFLCPTLLSCWSIHLSQFSRANSTKAILVLIGSCQSFFPLKGHACYLTQSRVLLTHYRHADHSKTFFRLL